MKGLVISFLVMLLVTTVGCKTETSVKSPAIYSWLLDQSSSASQVVDVQAACVRMRIAGTLIDCDGFGICHAKATLGDVFELYRFDSIQNEYFLTKQGVVTEANCVPSYLND